MMEDFKNLGDHVESIEKDIDLIEKLSVDELSAKIMNYFSNDPRESTTPAELIADRTAPIFEHYILPMDLPKDDLEAMEAHFLKVYGLAAAAPLIGNLPKELGPLITSAMTDPTAVNNTLQESIKADPLVASLFGMVEDVVNDESFDLSQIGGVLSLIHI